MRRILIAVLLFALLGCAAQSTKISRRPGFVRLHSQTLYVVPFDTVMVPEEVSAVLFNRFVDRLNQAGDSSGTEFVILKQGLTQIDEAWLSERDYLVGEVYAYVEEVGSTMTAIKARGRVRLYQPGQKSATLLLTLPADSFYQNDYSNRQEERLKLAEKISTGLADQLLLALFGAD